MHRSCTQHSNRNIWRAVLTTFKLFQYSDASQVSVSAWARTASTGPLGGYIVYKSDWFYFVYLDGVRTTFEFIYAEGYNSHFDWPGVHMHDHIQHQSLFHNKRHHGLIARHHLPRGMRAQRHQSVRPYQRKRDGTTTPPCGAQAAQANCTFQIEGVHCEQGAVFGGRSSVLWRRGCFIKVEWHRRRGRHLSIHNHAFASFADHNHTIRSSSMTMGSHHGRLANWQALLNPMTCPQCTSVCTLQH